MQLYFQTLFKRGVCYKQKNGILVHDGNVSFWGVRVWAYFERNFQARRDVGLATTKVAVSLLLGYSVAWKVRAGGDIDRLLFYNTASLLKVFFFFYAKYAGHSCARLDFLLCGYSLDCNQDTYFLENS